MNDILQLLKDCYENFSDKFLDNLGFVVTNWKQGAKYVIKRKKKGITN